MILKLKNSGMEVHKLCINHDPGMTLTYFRSPMHLNGENC